MTLDTDIVLDTLVTYTVNVPSFEAKGFSLYMHAPVEFCEHASEEMTKLLYR